MAVIVRFPAHRVRRAPSRVVFAPLAELEARTHALGWFVGACVGAFGLMAALSFVL